jgi:two-component system, NtrC family, nitrogen regulation sensor histidine kinase NtrY
MNFKQPTFRIFFSLLSSSLFFLFFYWSTKFFGNPQSNELIKQKFEYSLHLKEQNFDTFCDSVSYLTKYKSRNDLFKIFNKKKLKNLQDDGFSFSVFKGNKLWFWSSNEVVDNKLYKNNSELINTNNGWYVKRVVKTKEVTIYFYLLLKQEFSIKNNFLKDKFNNSFLVNSDFQISKENTNNSGIKIYFKNKTDYFFLFPSDFRVNILSQLFSILLLLISIFLFSYAISIFRTVIATKLGNWISISLFILILLGLREFIFIIENIDIVNNLEFFNPSYYAFNSYNPSLADLLINVFILFIIANELLHSNIRIINKSRFTSIYSILFFAGIHITALGCSILISSLVKDSVINFDLSNFYTLTEFSFVGIFITALIFFTFFTIASFITNQVSQAETNRDFFLVTFSISASIFFLLYFLDNPYYRIIYFSTGYIFLHWIFEKEFFEKEYFSRSIIYILLFAFWGAQILTYEAGQKKSIFAKNFADKIASEKDNIAEYLFPEIIDKILKDDQFQIPFNYNETSNQAKVKKIREKYFIGYWEKFDTKIYVYDTLCRLITKSPNADIERIDFFEKIYTKSENFSGTPNLYYIPAKGKEDRGLLATIKLTFTEFGKIKVQNLFIEFSSKFNAEEIGYPSLLVDKEFIFADEYNQYSYCKYKDGKLVSLSKDIDFKYNLTNDFLRTVEVKNGYFYYKNFNHYIYRVSKNTFYLVSYPVFSFSQKFNFTSYLFLIYGICFLIFLLIRGKIKNLILDFQTLNTRIRWVVILSVFLALTSFGGATILYFNNYFEQESRKKISGKLQNMLMDIGVKFGDENKLTQQNSDYYNYLLSKLYNVFGTDINLFDKNGILLASSRIKVFDEGILSNIMHPLAYKKMALDNESEYVNNEFIGQLNFVSIYVPLFNNENQMLGYIQLPFFSQQQEIKKEILNLAVILVNIYVLLFVVSGLFSVWLANRITGPLKILKQKFSILSLAKSNDLISYKKKDEIGTLISEYNKMVIALSESVQKLAQSEREGAWREMAKQVAHEIKNPLTPMKLSVQYLQKSLKEDPNNWPKKFEKVSITLIEQIEALNNIANEFSNFAVLPKINLSKINIVNFLEITIQLFQNTPNVSISFENITKQKNLIIEADREQMLRVFNNLIKNAIQAVETKKTGKIEIECSLIDAKNILIKIKDNGVGISQENFEKIFVPNFTTKSSGTGLGLAIVKNIIESFGGKVYFESEINIGSTFFMELPLTD